MSATMSLNDEMMKESAQQCALSFVFPQFWAIFDKRLA